MGERILFLTYKKEQYFSEDILKKTVQKVYVMLELINKVDKMNKR